MSAVQSNPRITFGLYSLMILDTTFQIWYGAWPNGYFEAARGDIKNGCLVLTSHNPYHKIHKRVIAELQARFNPRIKS